MNYSIVIKGAGHYIPSQAISNDQLSAFLDTSHEWIVERTGIHQRHFAAPLETTSDMGAAAAKKALINSQCAAEDIDMIVVATATADYTFPSAATLIQEKIKARNAFAFDVGAACNGYIVALETAFRFMQAGSVRRALVVGADKMSALMDPTDRSTYILFADGAGAVILERVPFQAGQGILDVEIKSDGAFCSLLYTDGGPGQQSAGYIRMQGPELFRHAVQKLTQVTQTLLERQHISVQEIDWVIPHQANLRILKKVAENLGLPMEKMWIVLQDYANTSAASIPLAFSLGVESGQIKRGQLIVHNAFGAGLIWGSAILRY